MNDNKQKKKKNAHAPTAFFFSCPQRFQSFQSLSDPLFPHPTLTTHLISPQLHPPFCRLAPTI